MLCLRSITSQLFFNCKLQVHERLSMYLGHSYEIFQGPSQLKKVCPIVWVHWPAAVCHHLVPVADRHTALTLVQGELQGECKDMHCALCYILTGQSHSRQAVEACSHGKQSVGHSLSALCGKVGDLQKMCIH